MKAPYLHKTWTNFELELWTSIHSWALPVSISFYYSNNNDVDEEYDWRGKPSGYWSIEILCFQLHLTYDSLGIE